MRLTLIVAAALVGALLVVTRLVERRTRPELADEYGD